MLVRDEPTILCLSQNRGAATAAGGFLAADEALPTELIAADDHIIGDDGPDDVVKTKDLVFD